MFESLESRRLLSVTLVEGELRIVGTHKADSISLSIHSRYPNHITVTFNGYMRRFALVDVEKINIQAGQGDDLVQIDQGKTRLNQPTRLYGSGGRDTIIGGQGKDRIYGGDGDDRIYGGNSRDIIYGQGGADIIDGQQGYDAIDGGAGNDTLTGGSGLDRLLGQEGDDTIYAKDGDVDEVNGGPGVDTGEIDRLLDGVVSIEIRR